MEENREMENMKKRERENGRREKGLTEEKARKGNKVMQVINLRLLSRPKHNLLGFNKQTH